MPKKGRGPTMNDVAREAEVSLKTVSRYINGEQNIDSQLAERIRVAVQKMGYRRNLAAASIRPGWTSKLVGLVISDLGNPFYSTLAGGIERELAAEGYVLTVSSSLDTSERYDVVLERFLELRVDGLIVVPPRTPGRFQPIDLSLNVPVVLLDRPAQFTDMDVVVAANCEGAMLGTQALLDNGAKRPAFLADSLDIYTMRERLRGFEDAVLNHGISLDQVTVFSGAHSAEESLAAAVSLMESAPIDSFFGANNRAALGILRAFAQLGRRLPMTSFDDFETADLINGGVSVVQQDVHLMAKKAARLLLARMRAEELSSQSVVVPVTFVSRGSERAISPH